MLVARNIYRVLGGLKSFLEEDKIRSENIEILVFPYKTS